MDPSRRKFLRDAAVVGTAGLVVPASVSASGSAIPISEDWYGVVTDLSLCIGCRKCEWACNNESSNDFAEKRPMKFFEDDSAFGEFRRYSSDSLTVVNKFPGLAVEKDVFVKWQCLHCADPACMSACLVTAFRKDKNGAVVYDPWRCMGCRYCLVACPFQVPAYEYQDPLTPRVRKCTLCFRERTSQGRLPACVEICPVQCMTYGKRSEILAMARQRINTHDGYEQHIYGEHEMGGTCWMFISKVPFEKLGFQTLPSEAPPRLVEGIQHSIFRYFVGPVALFGMLGAMMWNLKDESSGSGQHKEDHS